MIIVVGLICLFIKPVWKVFSDSDKSLNITTIAKGIKARMNKPPEVKKQKSWKTVFEKEFVGVGFTGGDEPKDNDGTIHTIPFGRNGILIGDKIIIKSNNFVQAWDHTWKKYNKPIINMYGKKDYFCTRAKKGVKFKVIVKRFM